MHSLSFVSDPKKVLESCYKMTKKGGYIFVVENGISDLKPFAPLINLYRKIWDNYN